MPITALLSLVAVVAFVLFLKEYFSRPKPSNQFPPPVLEENHLKSIELLHQAVQNANDIITNAENDALKVVEGSEEHAGRLVDNYEQRINQLAGALEGSFQHEVDLANKQYDKYLQDLIATGKQTQARIEETARQQVNDLFERFEQNLATFLTQTQQQSLTSIELEIKAARQLIDTYKAQQLMLVDENIIAILEKTLMLVLPKKLELKDHMELIKESLEKAKAEKFFV